MIGVSAWHENGCERNFKEDFPNNCLGEWSNSSSRRRTHDCSKKMIQQFSSEGSPIYLPKLGSVFSRTKSFCFENCILLAFGLGMCEGVGEDSRHGIGYVDIQVESCIFLSVIVWHNMCT